MLQVCINDKEQVLEAIKQGNIDTASSAFGNLIDDIVLKMEQMGLPALLEDVFEDKRCEKNKQIPLKFFFTLVIAAKMKIKTSLTDIPFAINDADTLAQLGWNLYDTERDIEEGLISDGMIRGFLSKYQKNTEYNNEFIDLYNNFVKAVKDKLDIVPYIHILDCTDIEVNLDNDNYEKSEVVKDEDGTRRGYKLATLRGLTENSGIIEEIDIGSIKSHDTKVSDNIIKNSSALKRGDILINDRGFISRDTINMLKNERGVDSYIPAKKNMDLYKEAVSIAKSKGKWEKHPNKKRKTQEIAFVSGLGSMWRSDKADKDVDINVCVVRDKISEEEYDYHVFMTTDLSVSAKQIIKTYELRPEVEEDYRQLKDFWKLQDFKSTKYVHITFHMSMLLIGYLFFQLYKDTEEGKQYSKKSLPIILKNYVRKKKASVVVYAGSYFATFDLLEIMQLYASCGAEVRKHLDVIFSKV